MNDEFGPNFVTLTDDEGKDIELEYIDALEYNGTTYMAFFPDRWVTSVRLYCFQRPAAKGSREACKPPERTSVPYDEMWV